MPTGTQRIPETECLPPKYRVTTVETEAADLDVEGQLKFAPAKQRAFVARLKTNRRLTSPDHFQDVRHLAFDTAGTIATYKPGDVAYIMVRRSSRDPALAVLSAGPLTRVASRKTARKSSMRCWIGWTLTPQPLFWWSASKMEPLSLLRCKWTASRGQ